MFHLAWCLVCSCDPTDAATEFLDTHDSIQDVCVIMCHTTVMLQLIQSTELNYRISFFSLFPEKKQWTSRPGAVCYLLCLFLPGFLFTGHWSVLMLTLVKHRAISSLSLLLKSESRWPTWIKVTMRNRRKKNGKILKAFREEEICVVVWENPSYGAYFDIFYHILYTKHRLEVSVWNVFLLYKRKVLAI